MNLQRREEISALLAAPVTGGAGQVLEYRDALMECRTHIDTLEQTAAERVIARGAVVKPHTFGEIINQVRDIANQHAGTEQLREQIAYALAPHFERDAGPTPDYTGEGSALVLPADARAAMLEDCPRVEQTVLHVPGVSRGNCFSASVAGLLKLPIDTIPQLVTTEDESWQEQFNGWLRQFGLAWFPMAGDDLASECQQYGISGLWSEMSGQSPRFEGGHSCVAKDGRLAWDPHPSQSGLEHPIWWHGVFIALRPWELVSCAIPADRVPRDGEVKILESERRELALLRQHFQLFEKERSDDLREADRAFNARQEVDELLRRHLRANQGEM